MKNLIKLAAVKLVLVAVMFVAGGSSLFGQQIKLGYINSQELVMAMPERVEVASKLEKLATELGNQMDEIRVEFTTKYEEYQQNSATYSPAIKTQKEKELQTLSERLQQFQQDAQADLETAQDELMRPLVQKAQDAIEKVAKDNKFTTVFDTASGIFLYVDDTTMVDVLPLVKKELGLQ